MFERLSFASIALAALALSRPASAQDGGKTTLPLPYAQRPLTLPEMTLSPALSVPVTHAEFGGLVATAVGLNLGASFGVTDDLTVDITPFTLLFVRGEFVGTSDTTVYYGTFRAGATYRFVESKVADIGARFEFGGTGSTESMHLTAGLPVLLRLADVVRIDTGMFWSLLLPTNGSSVDGGLLAVSGASLSGLGNAAGIPANFTFQLADPFFLGLDTGFGIASFRGEVPNAMFMPLGVRAGGTIADNGAPLVDLTGSFSFPIFLLGADPEPPTTELWQVGLEARAYIPL